jgi:hypothetical protein
MQFSTIEQGVGKITLAAVVATLPLITNNSKELIAL